MKAIKTRFIFSIIANILRAGIIFVCGILIARGLSPVGYGDLTFLLGSFVAVRALLDMGSSSAFYTFISKSPRCKKFYLFYNLWLAAQFLITLALVAVLIPSRIFENIWLGKNREIVVLAFVAVFLQQQMWQMVGQIGESSRKTIAVQLMNITVSIIYLVIIYLLYWFDVMNIQNVLWIIISLYSSAVLVGLYLLKINRNNFNKEESFNEVLKEYLIYCKPLVWLGIVGFIYTFTDKWMLQKFSGSKEQAFFQIASQFAQISLLATVSILNIFWKEIAEAHEKCDFERVSAIYRKISRGLVIFSSIIAGLLLPWAKQIVEILLGPAYIDAWPVLALMFLYPIHQSMGQICATMFMAEGKTKKYVSLSIALMLCTLPISYFTLAPESGMLLPGLGLGAMGMAGYLVLTGIISVNIQAWVIANQHGWQFDWKYQAIGIPLMIGLGYLIKILVGLIWELNGVGWLDLMIPMTFNGIIYAGLVILVISIFPWLIGMSKEELRGALSNLHIKLKYVTT